MISHAIFAFSHLTPPRTALSFTPPPTPLPTCAPPRAALRLSLCPSPCLPPCTPLCIPPELHPAPSTPLFTLLCAALLPPRASLHISPCTPTLHPIMRFTQHLDPHSHPYPSAKSLLPPVHPFPIRVSPSLSVPQPSPFTPYFTPHPIMPFTLRTDPIPHHPFLIRVSPSSVFLSQAPPVDFLVRKKARFTHDMTFFHHDVREKRFNTHEGSHKMEMIISKDHVADKPRRGWGLWRHGRP